MKGLAAPKLSAKLVSYRERLQRFGEIVST
jgi:hypothetical protein